MFDSWFDQYRGVVILVHVVDGELKPGMKVRLMASGGSYLVEALTDALMLRWFVRDLDIRSALVASTVNEPLSGLVLTGCEKPPVDTVQRGYRGLAMETVYNPRTLAAQAALNAVPML